jgi:hypothetical protein
MTPDLLASAGARLAREEADNAASHPGMIDQANQHRSAANI